MGFLKKITRPISRALDKIIPNEIKPALPFLAAAAPFMAPGLMGLGGNTMLSRALMSGGLNLGAQLAQEGSEGDFSGLSTLMAAATGALSAPGTTGGTPSAGEFFRDKAMGMDPGFAKSGLGALETSSNYLSGVSDTLQNNLFSMEGLKAALIPIGQGTTDLAVAENRRAMRDYEREQAEYEAGIDSENSNRAFAIRQSMEAYGFTEQEILDAIEAAGYRAGGRVGYAFGDLVRGSSMVQPVPNSSGGPMPRSGMGEMLSNLINSNPQIFSNLTGQTNNSVSNMSRDFIDLNQNGIDDRQEKAYGGRVGLKDGGRVGFEFGGIPAAVESVEEKPKEFLVDKLKVTVQPGQSEQMAIMNAMMNDIDEVMPEDRKMEFYKLYLPQLRASGEISENEYEGLMGELFGEGKKDGGRIGLKNGSDGSSTGSFGANRYASELVESADSLLNKGDILMTDAEKLIASGKYPSEEELNEIQKRYDALVNKEETETNKFSKNLEDEKLGDALPYFLEKEKQINKRMEDSNTRADKIGLESLDVSDITRSPSFREWYSLWEKGDPKADKLPQAEYFEDLIFNVDRKKYIKTKFPDIKMADGGLMNLGGREMDMRTGGFIPIGKKERADDVPARLSKNEFVMTADAVRAAGGGSVNEGARRMYNLMNNLEAKV
jgi:hypothetical protein